MEQGEPWTKRHFSSEEAYRVALRKPLVGRLADMLVEANPASERKKRVNNIQIEKKNKKKVTNEAVSFWERWATRRVESTVQQQQQFAAQQPNGLMVSTSTMCTSFERNVRDVVFFFYIYKKKVKTKQKKKSLTSLLPST